MLVLAADRISTAGNTRLGQAAVLGIATVALLITWVEVHPFLALILGSAVLGSVAAVAPTRTVPSFEAWVGSTVGSARRSAAWAC